MNKRIKEIRKIMGLTQVDFGNRIGVKGNTVTNYENGLRCPSDAVILSICREFRVDETWLRTGKGKMFASFGDMQDEYILATSDIDVTDPRAKQAILDYWHLTPQDKELFWQFIEKFVKK